MDEILGSEWLQSIALFRGTETNRSEETTNMKGNI